MLPMNTLFDNDSVFMREIKTIENEFHIIKQNHIFKIIKIKNRLVLIFIQKYRRRFNLTFFLIFGWNNMVIHKYVFNC